jgi:hypothetical protein
MSLWQATGQLSLGHKIGAAVEDVDGTTSSMVLEPLVEVVAVPHWEIRTRNGVWSSLEDAFEQTLEEPNAIHMMVKRDEPSEEAEVVAHGRRSPALKDGATFAAPETKPVVELVWTPVVLIGGVNYENGVVRSSLLS